MASELPLSECMHSLGVAQCAETSDCECEPDQAPLPICCLELGDMPEMLQPHSTPTPKPLAVWVEESSSVVVNVFAVRRVEWLVAHVGEPGPPLYLLYRVILR